MANRRSTYRARPASRATKLPTVKVPAPEPSRSLDTPVEIAFWIVFLTCAYQLGKYYWKVVFVTAALARLFHVALVASYGYLPNFELRFATIVLLGTWASAAFVYVLLLAYGISLTPLHLFLFSPIDAWTKYTANPDPVDEVRVHHNPGAKARIDIIAIHGLGSNPDTAWASNRGRSGKPVVWLRDLLPKDKHLADARIVQVNQQTRWDISVSTLTFDEHARNLLQILETVHDVRGRPIIFIAHSFGGLLLKGALRLAKEEESSVAMDTRGLLFLGVPHGGTEAALLASLLSCTAYWRGSSTTLLRYMAPGSDAIKGLEKGFYNSYVLPRLHRRQILPRIVDFSEQRPERIGPIALGKTVNYRTQGILHGEEVILDTDHRGLNKFATEDDPNYRKVLARLLTTVEYAMQYFSSIGVECVPTDNLPFERDMAFVPRHNIVADICQRIVSSRTHLRQAITGLGGMGKSQVAIEVSYSLREDNPELWVFWIRAGSTAKFKDSYSLIAYTVGILKAQESDTAANVPSLVLSWLREKRNGKWLIILDGADELSLFYPGPENASSPHFLSWLPRVAHGSVLITTRNRAVALNLVGSQTEPNVIYPLDSMTPEEAVQLLKSKIPESLWDKDNGYAIVKELEYIPLAISHAAAYIDYSVEFLEEYLGKIRALQEQPSSLVEIHDSRREDDASSSVVATWQTSLDQIRVTSETAAELLCLMSAFDNENIPEFFIAKPMAVGYVDSLGGIDPVAQKYIDKYGDKTNRPGALQRTDTTDSLDVRRTANPSFFQNDAILSDLVRQSDQRLRDDILLLYNYGMISIDKPGNIYSMHSLVQTAITKWLESGGKTAYTLQDYRDRALIEVSMAFKLEGIPNIYDRVALHQNAAKVLEYQVSHNVMCLHRAEVLYHQALYLRSTAQLELAETFIKEVTDIRRKYSLGYTLPVVKALEIHGGICFDLRRFDDAVDIFRDALDGFSLSMGFSRSLKNNIAINLAVSLMSLNRLEESKILIEDVIRSERDILGDDTTLILEHRRILADLYKNMGEHERAINELRDVVAMWERRTDFWGVDIDAMITCKYELIGVLRKAGQNGEAERFAEGLVPTAKAELGEGHTTTVMLQLSYSRILRALEKPQDAEAVLRDAYAQCLLAMETRNPVRQSVTFELIDVLHVRGKHSDIVGLEGLLEMDAVPQTNHLKSEYWMSKVHCAYALHFVDKFEEAKVVYEVALAGMEADAENEYDTLDFWKLDHAACLEDLHMYKECITALDALEHWLNSQETNQGTWVYQDSCDNLRRKAEEGLKAKQLVL